MNEPVIEIDQRTVIPIAEIGWQFTRSSGPGGQNVNKTATRVELLFDVEQSPSLDDVQKKHVRFRLGRLIDQRGVLHLAAQVSASQWRNREAALARFAELMAYALRPSRTRLPTRLSRAQRARRREDKSRQSQKKRRRTETHMDEW
ncbi:MAG: alternative ribosome rescue aminoacyl-tRNA hydrolase ArfB [Anaerolineae bacterium]